MDKNAIKKFAVWARRELISRVSQRAAYFEITEAGFGDPAADSVLGRVLSDEEKTQRQALIAQIQQKGYQQVMEEVAYIWFNRFIALRFMEVNGYLPSHVRVFTDEANQFKPQILAEAIHMELDGLDMQKVYALKNANNDDGLFKYMVIVQCNALSSILPGMFQRIADYTELLFPDNLLREGSVLQQMIAMIPEEDWKDAVQIIGWLYQFYNIEPKAEALSKKEKLTKEEIPAATQLFTTDWIVRYMVENSLGRLWVEGHPNDELKATWKYYLEEAEQEADVQIQLSKIRKEYATMTPEQIRCIDPCCGSGHILVYLFDVLVQIYESYGYTTREAVSSIVQNNLFGLDIDDRAAQLAYFAVMMKARQYDRRFFSRQIQPNVYAIQESNRVDFYAIEYFCNGDAKLKATMSNIIKEMHDAKEYGSILNITPMDFAALYARFDEVQNDIHISRDVVMNSLLALVRVADMLAHKYSVVVTNPPYLSVSGLSAKINELIRKNYPESKNDLYSVFIERCRDFTEKNGFQAMITQQAWMFTALYEPLRLKLKLANIVNLIQLGAHAFDEIGGEVVQTASFVIRNAQIGAYKGNYMDLTEGGSELEKESLFLCHYNLYATDYNDFDGVPNTSMAYWLSQQALKDFASKKIGQLAITREGMTTADNERFLREWYEVIFAKIGLGIKGIDEAVKSGYKWYPYNKGGTNRKWYGNNDLVVNWFNDGAEIRNIKDEKTGRIRSHNYNLEYSFRESGTWTAICSGNIMVRYSAPGALFDSKGASVFAHDEKLLMYIIGLLNSKVSSVYLKVLSPAYEFKVGHVANVPVISGETDSVINVVKSSIALSKEDWDFFEFSWNFKRHPLLKYFFSIHPAVPTGTERPAYEIIKDIGTDHHIEVSKGYPIHAKIQTSYETWQSACNQRFQQLKANEEELNRIFIDIYGLQDELTPEVAEKDVTVHYLVDTKDDIPASLQGSNYVLTRRDAVVSLISYAVGCMFGRYTIYADGLLYAGGPGWHHSLLVEKIQDLLKAQGKSMFPENGFYPDEDNVIPICDDEYFDDDIVGRFVKFIETVYGSDTLEENLKFVADALGGKGTPRDVIRSYFLNDFYTDHCKTYQKRPIYWLFDSGKKNGFKALIYMHRYQPDTIARIRTDYVHEQQSRYRTAIADLESRIASASTAERVKLNKHLKKLQEQDAELRTYEEKIHHLADQMISIDLDDGVKVNYAKFQDVLGKIK